MSIAAAEDGGGTKTSIVNQRIRKNLRDSNKTNIRG